MSPFCIRTTPHHLFVAARLKNYPIACQPPSHAHWALCSSSASTLCCIMWLWIPNAPTTQRKHCNCPCLARLAGWDNFHLTELILQTIDSEQTLLQQVLSVTLTDSTSHTSYIAALLCEVSFPASKKHHAGESTKTGLVYRSYCDLLIISSAFTYFGFQVHGSVCPALNTFATWGTTAQFYL